MKVIEAIVCVSDVSMTLHYSPGIEVPKELEPIIVDGIKSRAYRGGASKAKITKDDDYAAKVRKLKFGMKEVGLELVGHEAYVKPEAKAEMVKARKAYDASKAKGELPQVRALLKLAPDTSEDDIIKAIHARLYPKPANLLDMLTEKA